MTNKIILTNNLKSSSIVKVDGISYMPRPSYENFPALPIYSSSDENTWELSSHAIKDSSHLNLTGIPSAGGVWSPSLSYDGKKFHLVYSVVKSFGGSNLNLDNYITSTSDINKKWSEPTYLNSNKATSILIHHENSSYLISLRLNIEIEYEATRAIVMQEIDTKKAVFIGEETIIAKPVCRGELFSEILFEEVDDMFRLTLVEYTQDKKRATVLTSPNLFGMYHVLKFVDDVKPVEPTLDEVDAIIEVADNTVDEIVDTDEATETVEDIDDNSEDEEEEITETNTHINYITNNLDIYTLREMMDKDWCVKSKKGDTNKISLRGRSSLSSTFEQSFVGKLVTTSNYTFQTKLSFTPENIYQSAGIACYYNTDNYYYLRVYKSETFGGLTVGITSAHNGSKFEILHHGIKIGEMVQTLHLKVTKSNNELQFSYALFGDNWVNVSTPIDVSSIEAKHDGTNLVGITAQDQNNKSLWADFYNMELY